VSAGFGRSFDDLLEFLRENNARLDAMASEAGRNARAIRRSLLVGTSGFGWWKSNQAFDDFVGRVTEAGTQDLVFAYPPPGGIDAAAFLDLVAELSS
jgi:hypothetical protein